MIMKSTFPIKLLLFVAICSLSLLSPKLYAQTPSDAEKQGKEIYEKYQNATGANKIKTVETITETEAMGTKRKETRIEDKVNKKWYAVSEGGIQGKSETGFDGKRPWVKSNSFRGYQENAMSLKLEPTSHRKLPNETIEGKEYLVVEGILSTPNASLKTYYDPDTFLLFQRKLTLEISGTKVDQTIIYSDYRKIGDFSAPFVEKIQSGTYGTVTRRKLSVKFNIEVNPKIFEFENESDKKEDPKQSVTSGAVSVTANKDGMGTNVKTDWDMKNPDSIVPDEIKKKTFEKVWTTINDTYFDQTFNGVDWKGVRNSYEPQLADAKTNQNLIDLLNGMLGELKRSHLKVAPANRVSVNGISLPDDSKRGGIGIDFRLLNKSELVVVDVRKNSPAEMAGIYRGFVLKKIDGQSVGDIIAEQKKKGGYQLSDELMIVKAAEKKLSGDLDKKVEITIADGNDKERTVEIGRQNYGGSSDLNFESKQLTEKIGYIKFNCFFGDLPKQFAEAVNTFQKTSALIIDLRGNPGGIGDYTTALAAMIDKEKRSLGVSQYRYKSEQFAYEGNDKSYKGKVIILIDELTGSSSEIFAGGLQANKRALIIGQNSAGAVLPSTIELLPNGGALQFAIADFRTPDGKVLEGKGVTPDVEAKLTRKDLLEGRDIFLETALKLVGE